MPQKEITIYRKNEFVSYANTLSVFVNDKKFELPINSTLKTKSKESQIQIRVKYLWATTKLNLNDEENNFILRIRPMVSNITLIVSLALVLILFVLQYYFQSNILNLLFKIIGITFIAFMFFISTIGSKYFYKIDVNNLIK